MSVRKRGFVPVVVAVACTGMLTACGGGDDDKSSGVGNDASSGASSAKAPIKVGVVSDIVSQTQSFKESVGGVEARVGAINASGGINGRRIRLIKCDAKSDPNVGAACAQKFVRDEVVAVANPFSVASSSMQPVWSKAKIPVVGVPLLPVQYTDRYSYPSSVGLIGTYLAAGLYARQKGCRRAGVIASAVGAYRSAATNAKHAFASQGGRVVSEQSPPPGAPDYTPYLQSVLNAGATCLLYVVPNTDTAKLMTAVKQSRKPDLLVAGSQSAYAGLDLGSLGDGLIGGAVVGPRGRYAKSVADDRRKYAKRTKFNDYYVHGYGTMKVLEAGLRAVKGAVTSASIVGALDSLRSIDPAVTMPFSYRDLPFENRSYARVASMTGYVYELRNDTSTLRKTLNLRSTIVGLR